MNAMSRIQLDAKTCDSGKLGVPRQFYVGELALEPESPSDITAYPSRPKKDVPTTSLRNCDNLR